MMVVDIAAGGGLVETFNICLNDTAVASIKAVRVKQRSEFLGVMAILR